MAYQQKLKYGSVCSGIEAASVAWSPLGWSPSWFSEIEPFPSAVLASRWPGVENLGDMTAIAARITAGKVEAPDILVGGTPFQAFSVAGLRNSLTDARGQLTLSYVELANAIDAKRQSSGQQAAIFVWENVKGVIRQTAGMVFPLLDGPVSVSIARAPSVFLGFLGTQFISTRLRGHFNKKSGDE